MDHNLAGLILLIGAGAMNACFALPMKWMKRWAWENTWLVWSGFALLLLPLVSALAFVPSLREALLAGGTGLLLLIGLCGIAWGIAQVLFGLAIDMIGISLAFAIVLGLSAAVGGIVPFIQIAARGRGVSANFSFAAALIFVLIGVCFCAWAGSVRDRSGTETGISKTGSGFRRGLICAVCSGFCAAAMNIGVSLGTPIDLFAKAHGASLGLSETAVWLPVLEAGALPNLIYCVFLLRRNQTANKFCSGQPVWYWGGAVLMAVLWFMSAVIYTAGAERMGRFGLAIGWPVYMASMVVLAGVVGVITGEWKGAPWRAFLLQTLGMLILFWAIFLLAQSSGKL